MQSQFSKLVLVSVLLLMSACATQVTESPVNSERASTPLSEFEKVILVEPELAPEYAGQGANEKAVKKIHEVLATEAGSRLSNVEKVSLEDYKSIDLSSAQTKEVLIIKPYVKQIKFIGGAARFWAGAMAGSSVVIMDTAFIDAATNDQIGITGSFRKAGAYSDIYGVASNVMLEDVARDVGQYISVNR